MNLTIAIPTRGVSTSLIRVIEHAISLKADEIIVGINPDNKSDIELPEYEDPRIKIFEHQNNLGLYGNFRFLVENASGIYFAWLCTDDQISSTAVSELDSFIKDAPNLVIPNWEWVEYHPNPSPYFDTTHRIKGVYPNLESKKGLVDSALHSEPSWIFGIWKTSYLQKIFPKKDFDWLDTHLLQKVLVTRKVKIVSTEQPTLIGTWHWAGKIPGSVNQKGHNPIRAILRQLGTAPRLLILDPKCGNKIFLRIKFLVLSAFKMNRKIRER